MYRYDEFGNFENKNLKILPDTYCSKEKHENVVTCLFDSCILKSLLFVFQNKLVMLIV